MTEPKSPLAERRDAVEPVASDHFPTRAPRAEWAYKLRRMRDRILGGELFGEPAWDALLYLAAARERNETARFGRLAIDIRMPEDALRKVLANLGQAGLVLPDPTGFAGHDSAIALSEEGYAKLSSVLG